MTTNAFARFIGLSRAENLYQIKRGNNGISSRLAERIAEKFPEISKSWLLTGRGAMFVEDEEETVVVPYFEEDFFMALGAVDALEPACDMVMPAFARCDFAMRCGAADNGTVTVLLLKRRQTDDPVASGEYAVLTGVRGSLLTFTEGEPVAELTGRLFCEVTGRLTITRPAPKR